MYHAGKNSDMVVNNAPRDATDDGAANRTLRVLTINLGLLGFELKSGWRMPVDSYLKERLVAAPSLLLSLEADVIALQEVYSAADRELLVGAMAARFPFCAVSPKTRSLVGNGLMLLSRFPILRSAFMPARGAPLWTLPFWKQGLLAVDLDLPSIGLTRLINAHIASSVPFGRAGSSASKANRSREIARTAVGGRVTPGRPRFSSATSTPARKSIPRIIMASSMPDIWMPSLLRTRPCMGATTLPGILPTR